ncbi:HNH endonuclease signature motif containing protein [Streptomyces sp. HB2AG]|uniref:HNH endonuclease signature motif containing protein n=1 Tax=Streptomyces sp. HB2AG TaxID=2983400 RepID=UPI0022AB2984|nr:HNH endonuclease signature motif containing protein [Streptomyces sp. HB2AG]MCZ2523367.1 HNH endonuclease signature motif containing protein [Streptomyces sp. HB2AG]
MPAKYTRELLTEAAARSTCYSDLVRAAGGVPTAGSRRYARKLVRAHGIDTSHFRQEGVRHTEERLREIVRCSRSVNEVVRKLGISPVGGNQAHIGRRIRALGIDTSHFEHGGTGGSPKTHRPLLVLSDPEQGRARPSRLRKALKAHGRAEICAGCGTGTEWYGVPLRLEVDHVNGDWWDNRPENLRFLCPNCHSVTDTYRGRAPQHCRGGSPDAGEEALHA